MSMKNIVVIGGGYAGLNAVQSLIKEIGSAKAGGEYSIVLVDKNPHHFRKVLLFKEAVEKVELTVPFSQYFAGQIRFIQAALTAVDPTAKTVQLLTSNGTTDRLEYDRLIIALGSTLLGTAQERGGLPLQDRQSAEQIRQEISSQMRLAHHESSPAKQAELLRVAVIGAGITGIETSSEIAVSMKSAAAKAGIDPRLVEVFLINSEDRLLTQSPEKISRQLERELNTTGVRVLQGVKGLRFTDGQLELDNGSNLSTATCIWTVGMQPNSLIKRLGLPVEDDGRLCLDDSYHVKGFSDIYAIGDCAKAVDPVTGQADRMTCKEAIAQAQRLGKVIRADLSGTKGARHQAHPILYCIGLGPGNGFVWVQKWGLDIALTGKLAWKIREYTWNIASLIKGR